MKIKAAAKSLKSINNIDNIFKQTYFYLTVKNIATWIYVNLF